MRRLLLLLALLAAGGTAAWVRYGLPPRVTIAMASQGTALEAVYATGTVEPVQWARIGPATRARLTEVLVEERQRVTEGQPMARLDDRQARSLVAEAEARARFAADDLARTRTLVARDISARTTLDRAERDAQAAEATARAARQRLDDYVVRAPTDGVVLRRDAEVGEVVDTPASLFWVGEPRPLRITAEVDEEDIARIRLGQRVLLRADAFPGQALTATVAQITPKGDTVRKAYRVRLALPDDTPLLVGMTVEANIVLRETPDAVLVPQAALVLPPAPRDASPSAPPAPPPGAPRQGHVWVVEKEVAQRRAVQVGVESPRNVEIRQGLRAGEAVVLNPPPGLTDGAPVRLQAAAAPPG
ncbi:efflux RND transporter periplasmic adaptor subunit [Falsiroseomonas selenitidurans]|uniref:Efflux RND transporter periplasmic adaptor subunit n=1 Tax=Falsiroseomonas selenitidurans TaxID=2716335 RepID=A0ABX1ECI5_9PROT|nr:efflux RND transporter periplasmic adaptor subunit [Falsiroseomonas selenitidurans]NKC34588.1 efflux RND transporter periplasmic adaptor subunit [Falsiroseomonas selenitidurans]